MLSKISKLSPAKTTSLTHGKFNHFCFMSTYQIHGMNATICDLLIQYKKNSNILAGVGSE